MGQLHSISARGGHPTVFVVEDDEDIRSVIAQILEEQGYSVRSAASARDALTQLEIGAAPDVILLDLMMPGMSGWEFRAEQRTRPNAAGIPLVAISADRSAKARAIDADAFLPKPFQPQQLIETVERVLTASERKRLETHLAASERLRSLGLLAAGIGHEVNNPLALVAGNAALLQKTLQQLQQHVKASGQEQLEAATKYVSHIADGADRIAAAVRSVSAFAQPDEGERVAVDVHAALDSSARLISNEIRHRARLERSYGEVPRVLGNPSQLGQVFVNLLMNAVHAIPEGNAAENFVRLSTSRSPKGGVIVEIADSGHGIAPELVGRIFDPFFTTKPVGAGMGLGLSISHRVVTAMGGNITVESEPGKGATFKVELPAFEEAAQTPPAPALTMGHEPKPVRALVIDDEPLICDLLASMLSDACEVVACTDPRAALRRVLTGEPFDVVLCDLMMPDLTGMDFFEECKQHRPELVSRIIFMTGGTFTDRGNALLKQLGTDQILYKPFRQTQVLQVIRERARHTEALSATLA